jgi:hypothetical protein
MSDAASMLREYSEKLAWVNKEPCDWRAIIAWSQALMRDAADALDLLQNPHKVARVLDEKRLVIEENTRLLAEVGCLRSALIQAGRNAGAVLADTVSSDFLMEVPEEVRLKIARLRQDRELSDRLFHEERGKCQDMEIRACRAEDERDRLLSETSDAGERVAQLEGLLDVAVKALERLHPWVPFSLMERGANGDRRVTGKQLIDDALAAIRDGQQMTCPECGNDRGHHHALCGQDADGGIFVRKEAAVPAELAAAVRVGR